MEEESLFIDYHNDYDVLHDCVIFIMKSISTTTRPLVVAGFRRFFSLHWCLHWHWCLSALKHSMPNKKGRAWYFLQPIVFYQKNVKWRRMISDPQDLLQQQQCFDRPLSRPTSVAPNVENLAVGWTERALFSWLRNEKVIKVANGVALLNSKAFLTWLACSLTSARTLCSPLLVREDRKNNRIARIGGSEEVPVKFCRHN